MEEKATFTELDEVRELLQDLPPEIKIDVAKNVEMIRFSYNMGYLHGKEGKVVA